MTRNRTMGQQFWKYVRDYLTMHLPKIRCVSPRTVDSYRQSIAMYCVFLKEHSQIKFSNVSFDPYHTRFGSDVHPVVTEEKVRGGNLQCQAVRSQVVTQVLRG